MAERDWAAHYAAQEAAAEDDERERWLYSRRTPLRTNQHILHLLLTVVTAGLWLPVWIIRAIVGNRQPASR